MLCVFSGFEHSAGVSAECQSVARDTEWSGKGGQEEIPAALSITGLAMSFRTQHPAGSFSLRVYRSGCLARALSRS